MNSFTFHNPTKIIFGEGQIASISKEIPQGQRILIAYGGGSIKQNGVYDQVIKALKGYQTVEFSGIEPNPTYETLMKAVAIVKEQNVNFILAVGGGSVIDGVKFIAAAAHYEGEDAWDILKKWAPVKSAVPFGAVLTLPATGSEMNSGSVVSRAATKDKLFFGSPLTYPKFSVLDPSVTLTLPLRQVGNGVVDAFTHVMEQYLTYAVNAPIQDRFSESLLKTLIEEGRKVIQDPKDLSTRANIMWAATLALNGLIGAGVPQDWTTHMIGHELTAKFGIDHARTLALVLPGTMKVMKSQKEAKLLQYAERVWDIKTGSDSDKIDQAIAKTEGFFEDMGLPTRLSKYEVTKNDIPAIIEKLKEHNMVKLGERHSVTPEVSAKILEAIL